MRIEKINEILAMHKLWLNNEAGGKRADLSGANLSRADLSWANLTGANLSRSDLSGANLTGTNLSRSDLSGANLSGANLTWTTLTWANLTASSLSSANLLMANLSWASLSRSDLSGAIGLISTSDFLEKHFERTPDGYIAYKTFNSDYEAPDTWKIEEGTVIEENVNFNRCDPCGCGINVAPLEWVKKNYKGDIWKVLIRWEWLCGVCVPYMSDGKIRCERAELVEVVK